MTKTIEINGIKATTTPALHTFLVEALGNDYIYIHKADSDLFLSNGYATEVVFYRNADGRTTAVEMAGYKKPNGTRPGLYHFRINLSNGSVVAVQNDAWETEKNTKMFKMMRTAIREVVAAQ